MKLLVVLALLTACAHAVSPDPPLSQKQRDVLLLLSHINQVVVYPFWKPIIDTYNISEHVDDYQIPEVVHQFEEYYPNSILPKGEIFSVFYQSQLNEAIVLYKLLYNSITYDTFYKTAVVARHLLNQGLFLYAFSVAVVHHPLLQGVVLPPIYEVSPQYFYHETAIHQAYILKQTHDPQHSLPGSDSKHGIIVQANYTGYYLNLHQEQKTLSYYLEDVGINAFYYYYYIYYPFWLSAQDFKIVPIKRGEQYLYLYQNILARYYFERLSHGLGEIPYLNWNVPVQTPFYSALEYPNGLNFPSRLGHVNLQDYYYNYGQTWTWKGPYGHSNTYIQDYESRLANAIDSGFVYNASTGHTVNLYTPEGLDILGNIIESNPDSTNHRYVGYIWLYASHLLGYSYQPVDQHHILPSALENFETALRDPVVYQLYKKLIMKVYRYIYNLPPYTVQDVIFPGVEIVNVELDKLVTYKELFHSEITMGVFLTPQEITQDSFRVNAVQQRLNHKIFNYKIIVNSKQITKAVVKIYIAPLVDENGRYQNASENSENLVILDYFVQALTVGENVIVRNSNDTHLYGPDLLSYRELYEQAVNAQQGKGEFSVEQNPLKFPHRYMLPQGTHEGLPVQFVVYIYPYVASEQQLNGKNLFYPYEGQQQFIDKHSLFFPVDRPIVHDYIWLQQVPNVHILQTKIYHVDDPNSVLSEH